MTQRSFGRFRLGRWLGTEVSVDASVLVLFWLIGAGFGLGVLPRWHPGWSAGLTWGVSLAAAFAYAGSILVHELVHAAVARAVGMPVRGVALFAFGGVAHSDRQPPTPRAEAAAALAGPLASTLIAVLATIAGLSLAGWQDLGDATGRMSQTGPLEVLLLWLGPLNAALAAINLVPGLPLDGGRLLHAFVWWRTGDSRRGAVWAARTGLGLGWALLGAGVVAAFVASVLGGALFISLGAFLIVAARVGLARVRVRDALAGVTVGDAMRRDLTACAPDQPAGTCAAPGAPWTPVVDRDGRLLGAVYAESAEALDQDERTRLSARDVMIRVEGMHTIAPDVDAYEALHELTDRRLDALPVVRDGRLVGVVSTADIAKEARDASSH